MSWKNLSIQKNRLVALLCALHRGCEPPRAQGHAHARHHFLRAAVRAGALRVPHGLLHAAGPARPLVSVGVPAGARRLPHGRVVPLHDGCHPVHRFHADRHPGGAGAGDGRILWNHGLRRDPERPRGHGTRDGHSGRDVRDRRRQRYGTARAFPQALSPAAAAPRGPQGLMPAEPEDGADGRTFGTAGRCPLRSASGFRGRCGLPGRCRTGRAAVASLRCERSDLRGGACGRDVAERGGGRASSGDDPPAGANFFRGMQGGMRIAAVTANV